MKRFRIPDGLRLRARSANVPYAPTPPKRRLRRPDLDGLRDRRWPRPRRPRRLHGPDMEAFRDREWARPRWLALPGLAWLRIPEVNVPARLLVPGIAVILLLFGGGLYFGNVLGSDPSAASLITTVKGRITIETVRGKRVKVTLPGRTITRRKTQTVHGRRSTLTQTATQTQFRTHTQLVPVPTTITRTSTVTKTIPTTVTVTVTTTVPTT
jgi:hypothetical protein